MKKRPILSLTWATAVAGLIGTACVVTPGTNGPDNVAKTTDHRAGTDHRTPNTSPPPRAGGASGEVKVEGSVVIDWRRGRIGSAARFTIEPSMGPAGTVVNIFGDFRPAVGGGAMTCTFAGASAVNPYFVSLRRVVVRVPEGAQSGVASCTVGNQTLWSGRFTVTPKLDDIFVPMDEESGVLGAVYRIPQGTSRLPDFGTLGDPIGTFVVPTIHVSPRNFDRGFPGLDAQGATVKDWYALRYIGLVDATREADYTFKLKASDGARLYVDDKLVIDNDGVHPPQDKEGTIHLTQGKHRIVVEYFKASGAQIALELWWKRGNNPFSGVAKHSLSRYSVEYNCSAEPIGVMCCKAMTAECRMCAERHEAAMAAWRQQCRP